MISRVSPQQYWRITGGVAILVCAAMTVFSRGFMSPQISPMLLLVYWSVWLVLFVLAMYCVLIDLRFLRLRFLAEERDLLKETLDDPTLRAAILDAQRELQNKNSTQSRS